MDLSVHPIEHADVAQCIDIRIASLGSLVIGRPPAYHGYRQESEAKVHRELDSSPHVHHLKLVDPDYEEDIMAYAKWEIYPHGREDLDNLQKPIDKSDMEVDQYGSLREAAHDYFCRYNGNMGKHPHILLALLVTSSQHRRRGAGSLLVQLGIQKSEELGLPAYLQASEQGRRLYSHHGFHDIDSVEFNLSAYGLDGSERMTEMLRKPTNYTSDTAARS